MKFDRQQLDSLLKNNLVQVDPLQKDAVPSFTVHLFETLPSTNRTLWDVLAEGASEGTAVIALEQQAGRGQWGRQWQSLPGGLYLSLALTPELTAEQGAQLTLCSAWGIATALRHYGIPVGLKWLNDLVINGRKLGGILTETRLQQGYITQAVVGVGINWTNPTPDTGISLQTVMADRSIATITSLEQLAAIVLQGIMLGYRYWQQNGIEAIVSSYENLLINLGQAVRVGDRSGQVIGVSTTAELRVLLEPDDYGSPSEVQLKPGDISLGYSARLTESTQ